MRRDFNMLMSDLNGTALEKLLVTTAIVPVADDDSDCGCCGQGCCGEGGEVYAARVAMDDGTVRGVISRDSMEDALGKAVAQVMKDLEEADVEEEEEEEEEVEEYESYEYDYDDEQDDDDDEEEEEEVDIQKTIKEAVSKAVEEVLKRLPRQEPKEKNVSTRHIAALKATVDEVGFDRAVEILEKIGRK